MTQFPNGSIRDCLISQLPELTSVSQIRMRKDLDHKDADHLLLRIDPEPGPGSSAPVVLAFRSCNTGLPRPAANRHRKSEPIAVSDYRSPRHVPQMVRSHYFHSLAAQDPNAVELPAVQQHLAKTQVCLACRHRLGPAPNVHRG